MRDYNVAYTATTVNNGRGDSSGPPNFDAFTYANVPRLIWITETQWLGGNVGVDALIPLTYQSVRAGGYDHNDFGAGDLFAEATLSWHVKQFDFSFGSGLWMPTGDFDPHGTKAGLGCWTPMLTGGATWYVDEAKTWAVSALTRYEFNTEQDKTHVTRGQAFTLEWGVSKTLAKLYDVGVVGYYQQKVTDDRGPVLNVTPQDRVAAIGPEISVAIPKIMLFVSGRYLYEFMSENRAQGHTFTLTLTKRF